MNARQIKKFIRIEAGLVAHVESFPDDRLAAYAKDGYFPDWLVELARRADSLGDAGVVRRSLIALAPEEWYLVQLNSRGANTHPPESRYALDTDE